MRVIVPFRLVAGVLLCGMTVYACSQSPVAPSRTEGQPSSEAVVLPESSAAIQAENLSPEDVVARGWDCRPAPMIPNRVTCSPPNQPHPITLPGPPPPPDRPATFTLLVFDNGVFYGTDLLIRSDLYGGQPCKSTGGPYRLIPRIGYYECVHLKGGE
jgi:hypothetical protein